MKKKQNTAKRHVIVPCKDIFELTIADLLDVAEKGVPDYYECFELFLYDFWWNLDQSDEKRKTIRKILTDKRFVDIVVPMFKKRFDFDMDKEMRPELKVDPFQ